MERWAPIPGYSGYEVSDCGRVRSLDRSIVRKDGASQRVRGRVLAQQTPGFYKYLSVCLHNEDGEKRFTVHRLVAAAFLTPDSTRPFVNHKDGSKVNNHFSNLEWSTKSENTLHSFNVIGREPPKPRKPVVVGGVRYPSILAAATAFGVSPGHVHSALSKGHRCKGMEVVYG